MKKTMERRLARKILTSLLCAGTMFLGGTAMAATPNPDKTVQRDGKTWCVYAHDDMGTITGAPGEPIQIGDGENALTLFSTAEITYEGGYGYDESSNPNTDTVSGSDLHVMKGVTVEGGGVDLRDGHEIPVLLSAD
jgi:hypothetical protein